jgi:uncharacterized protein YuzB (UPF0349 family)
MDDMKLAVRNRIPKYVEGGVRESLLRNRHMNRFGKNPQNIDEKQIPKVLERFADSTHFTGKRGIDVLEALTKNAKDFRYLTGLALHQTTVDALLTDFINYCGCSAGIDYALYATDLETPEELVENRASQERRKAAMLADIRAKLTQEEIDLLGI